MDTFDYIIIGAGAAGCALTYRLSAEPKTTVLLLEAGGLDAHPLIHMPKGIAKMMADPNYTWPFVTEPEHWSYGVAESWARGRTLGGSSAVNGMVYVRGQSADFDALARLTSDDWGWSRVGRAYAAMENHALGSAATRGDGGPLRISMPTNRSPLLEAAINAGVAMGLKRKDDVNDPDDSERVGYAPRTIAGGRRQSAAVAFLRPIRRRRNVFIDTGVTVNRIEFNGRRAVAVTGSRRGAPARFRARREILLCAGALSSPAILQRSGIGPAEHLRSLGIDVLRDSQEVGQNLREHRGLVMQWRVADRFSQNRKLRGALLPLSVAQYYLTRSGAMSSGAYDVGVWFKSHSDAARPDGQILIAPHTFDYSNPAVGVEPHGGMNFCVYPLRPESRGSILIRTDDPATMPKIVPNYNDSETDRRTMLNIVRFARRLAATPPLSEYVVEETRPGPQYQNDEEILEAHRRFGYGSYHASGSCRMGNDEASVVDPELVVRGFSGLRVVDTSVFPFMLAGNTVAPAMAMAWRAADLIAGGRP